MQIKYETSAIDLGGSIASTIPKTMVENMEIQKGDKIEILFREMKLNGKTRKVGIFWKK